LFGVNLMNTLRLVSGDGMRDRDELSSQGMLSRLANGGVLYLDTNTFHLDFDIKASKQVNAKLN